MQFFSAPSRQRARSGAQSEHQFARSQNSLEPFTWERNQLVISGQSACSTVPCKVRVNVNKPLGGERRLSFAIEDGTGRMQITVASERKELSYPRAEFAMKDEWLGATRR